MTVSSQVLERKRLGGAQGNRSGVGEPIAVCEGAFKSLFVEPDRRVRNAGFGGKASNDVVCVRPARYSLRTDKGRDLNRLDTGLRERVDQFDFGAGRNRPRLDLKAFARSLLDDVHCIRKIAHRFRP